MQPHIQAALKEGNLPPFAPGARLKIDSFWIPNRNCDLHPLKSDLAALHRNIAVAAKAFC